VRLEAFDAERGDLRGRVRDGEKLRRGEVYPLVGRLRGEDDRDQQLEGRRELQLALRIRDGGREPAEEFLPLRRAHSRASSRAARSAASRARRPARNAWRARESAA